MGKRIRDGQFSKLFTFNNIVEADYVYDDVVDLEGNKLTHIGMGIYMFSEPLTDIKFDESYVKDLCNRYRDIKFIKCYENDYSDESPERILGGNFNTGRWIIAFAISDTHPRNNTNMFEKMCAGNTDGLDIPESLQHVFSYFTDYVKVNDAKGKIVWNIQHVTWSDYDAEYRNRFVSRGTNGYSGLLDFKCTGSVGCGYIKVCGYMCKRVIDNVYYVCQGCGKDDTILYGGRYRLVESDMVHDENINQDISVLCKEVWDGGSISALIDMEIYYIAFDEHSSITLKKLSKHLSGYIYRHYTRDDLNKMRNMDALEVNITKISDVKTYECDEVVIPEGAEELLEGIGFYNVAVRCRLLLHELCSQYISTGSNAGFVNWDIAYIHDNKLHLYEQNIYNGETYERHINLSIISEIAVGYKTQLHGNIMEDIVQVVWDNSEPEKQIVGEDYEEYVQYIKYCERYGIFNPLHNCDFSLLKV